MHKILRALDFIKSKSLFFTLNAADLHWQDLHSHMPLFALENSVDYFLNTSTIWQLTPLKKKNFAIHKAALVSINPF